MEIDVNIVNNQIDVSLSRVGPQGPAGTTGAPQNLVAQPNAPTQRADSSALQDGDIWINTSVDPHTLNIYNTDTSSYELLESGAGGDHVPFYSSTVMYNPGDVIAFRIPIASTTLGGGTTCLLYTSPSPRDS